MQGRAGGEYPASRNGPEEEMCLAGERNRENKGVAEDY